MARLALCGVFLFVPYQVQYGAELRTYSALQLAAVSMVWAAGDDPCGARGASVGLRVRRRARHLRALLHLSPPLPAPVRPIWCCAPPGALTRRAVLAAGTVGVLLFVPWFLTYFSWLYTDPEQMLPPAERQQALEQVAEQPGEPEPRSRLHLGHELRKARGRSTAHPGAHDGGPWVRPPRW